MTIATTLPWPSAWGTPALTPLVPLAKELDENQVTPGVLGFIVFALLGGAVWLLMKSMNKQFRKIDFEEAPVAAGEGERGSDGPEAKTSGRPAATPKRD
ncbi:hypothetical protein [Streptomyces sp. 7N604]|uniref:hypothetical protein n=1 Tax=Streptomyces sp. 7N604 TaxID=3457415 RepID=UPI003FD617CC